MAYENGLRDQRSSVVGSYRWARNFPCPAEDLPLLQGNSRLNSSPIHVSSLLDRAASLFLRLISGRAITLNDPRKDIRS